MASTGKKGKKGFGKGKTISLNDFVSTGPQATGGDAAVVVVPSKSSWADDEDDYVPDNRYSRGGAEKVILPTAPRASLGSAIDSDRIPNHPPFTAYIANLSYDIDVEDVYKFFEKQNVTNIRLLRDGDPENGRLKGFGYADFGDRQSLVDALAMNDNFLKNRKIKIDISTNSSGPDRGGQRGGFGDRMGNNRMDNNRPRDGDDGEDRTGGDWRSGGGLPPMRDDGRGGGRDDRGGYGGDRDRDGGDRQRDNRGYGFGGGRDDRGGGGYDRGGDRGGDSRPFDRSEMRGGYDRDRRDERGGGGYDRDRRDDRGGGGYDRDRRGGYGGDRRDGGGYDRGGDRGGYDRPSGGDRYERWSEDRRSPNRDDGGPPRERPRLQLAKRTAPAEGAAPASSGPSPFGAAKPVNTAAKEREIEEKLAKDKPQNTRNTREQRSRTTSERSDDSRENNRQKDAGEEKSDRSAPPASKSNPFGNAKPVDRSERPERSANDSRENNRENRQIDEEPKSDRPPPPAAKSNPFGNARPIDSTKREREMEEKLRKTDISEDKPRSNQQKSQNDDTKTA